MPSKKEYTLWFATMSKTSSLKGKGYEFLVATLKFWKSTHIFNFPFFFWYHNYEGKPCGFLHQGYGLTLQLTNYPNHVLLSLRSLVHPIPGLMGWWAGRIQFNPMLGYMMRWYPIQILIGPCKNIFVFPKQVFYMLSCLKTQVCFDFDHVRFFCSYWPKLMDTHVQILGAPIQLMGCFEVYPSTCWVFFVSKYECWIIDLILFPISLLIFGFSLAFLYHKVSYHYEMQKKIHMTNFLNDFF